MTGPGKPGPKGLFLNEIDLLAYRGGETLATLAERLGVAVTTIRSALRRQGEPIRGHRKQSDPKGVWAEIFEQYQVGHTSAQLGFKYGLTKQRISQIVRLEAAKRGVQLRKRKKPRKDASRRKSLPVLTPDEIRRLGLPPSHSEFLSLKALGDKRKINPQRLARAFRKQTKHSVWEVRKEALREETQTYLERWEAGESWQDLREEWGVKACTFWGRLRRTRNGG